MLQKIPEMLSLIEHQKYKRFLGEDSRCSYFPHKSLTCCRNGNEGKIQRRLDSRPQSIMDIERLIPRVASFTVDCRGVNISLTKKIWKLSNDKSSVRYSVKTAYLLYCCDLHYDLCFTIASLPFFKLHGMCFILV